MRPELEYMWKWKGETSREATTFQDFQTLSEEFMKPRTGQINRFLFRGVSNHEYDLIPSIVRLLKEYEPWLDRDMLFHLEQASTHQFQKKARLYSEERFLPVSADMMWQILTAWQLMQHHGAPTRLLDWTPLPFVALYFAVVKDLTKDGAVWIIDHGAHSDRMKELHPEDNIVQLKPSSPSEEKRLFTRLFFEQWTIPNERMLAQHGWFSCASVNEKKYQPMSASRIPPALTNISPVGTYERRVIPIMANTPATAAIRQNVSRLDSSPVIYSAA